MSRDMNFKNSDSLEFVRKLLNEAENTLSNNNRTTKDVEGEIGEIMNKILKSDTFGASVAAGGIATGGIAGVGLLSILGTSGLSAAGITSGLATAGSLVGGGMVAGIGVLASPAIILGGGAYAVATKIKQKKLVQEKEILIQQIILTHDKIIFKLEKEKDASQDRINHLKLNLEMLMAIKKDMEYDLNG